MSPLNTKLSAHLQELHEVIDKANRCPDRKELKPYAGEICHRRQDAYILRLRQAISWADNDRQTSRTGKIDLYCREVQKLYRE